MAETWESVAQHPHAFARDGRQYLVHIEARRQSDGTIAGRLLFLGANGERLVTDRETTQPTSAALQYWATGLEHVYLEGAFARAKAVELPA